MVIRLYTWWLILHDTVSYISEHSVDDQTSQGQSSLPINQLTIIIGDTSIYHSVRGQLEDYKRGG